MKKNIFGAIFILTSSLGIAQEQETTEETNNQQKPKVIHAEPLYADLMRDLGARKGEKEWNLGMQVRDDNGYYTMSPLIEYEFAIIDRLGLEVELPFTVTSTSQEGIQKPGSKLDGLKLAAMYTFLVSEKSNFSAAIGYVNEIEFNEFNKYDERFFTGNVFNPFFVAAKRWGRNFHSLVYAGPVINRHFEHPETEITWEVNTSFHFMRFGQKNFVGVEFNKVIDEDGHFSMTVRPQARVVMSDQFILGIATGIPLKKEDEGFSGFFRLIYEPKHKTH